MRTGLSDFVGDEFVARRDRNGVLEPDRGVIVERHDSIAVGRICGRHGAAAGIDEDQVRVHGIEVPDDPEPRRRRGDGLRRCCLERLAERPVSRPETDIGGALVEIAHDQLHQRLGKIDEASPL